MTMNDSDGICTWSTIPNKRYDYASLGFEDAFGLNDPIHLVSCVWDGGYMDIYMTLIPFDSDSDGASRHWAAGDYITLSSAYHTYASTTGISYNYSYFNSAGTPVIRRARLLLSYQLSGEPMTYVASDFSSNTFHEITLSTTNTKPSFTPQTLLSRIADSSTSFTLPIGWNGAQADVGAGTATPFPVEGDTVIIEPSDAIYYTRNVAYPHVTNLYPVWKDYPPPAEQPTTEPTEETTETTTGPVIIIDPFTLPPEWLESNAELDTEHYTIPYTDIVQDPWEQIQEYAVTESATGAEAEPQAAAVGDLQEVTNGTPGFPAPPEMYNTIDELESFCLDLLHRSGLLAIFASLIACGIVIRFISIK